MYFNILYNVKISSSANILLPSCCLHFYHFVVSLVKELNKFGTHWFYIYMSYVFNFMNIIFLWVMFLINFLKITSKSSQWFYRSYYVPCPKLHKYEINLSLWYSYKIGPHFREKQELIISQVIQHYVTVKIPTQAIHSISVVLSTMLYDIYRNGNQVKVKGNQKI